MTSRITAYRKLLFVRDSNKERESPHLRAAQGKGTEYRNIVPSSPSRYFTVIERRLLDSIQNYTRWRVRGRQQHAGKQSGNAEVIWIHF